jgi:hypothetical protein
LLYFVTRKLYCDLCAFFVRHTPDTLKLAGRIIIYDCSTLNDYLYL